MLKKSIYSFVLISYSLPLVFLLTGLCIQQWIRWEKIEELEHAQLMQVTIPRSSISWIKKEKELLIQGKLFDVKSIEEKGDQVTLTGLFDHKETEIVDLINIQLAKGQDSKQLRTTFICSLLLGLSIPAQSLSIPPSNQQIIFFPPLHFLIPPSPFLDQLTPPPQC